ncbi:Glycosyltransferase involved in cell wall bisynthesis [Singulisphaera sp. GP187]|uniref:glycosyltransferase family 4 protein n=1 Tax=Singulisphaera sp. GP187 TaxID=1882752 RepID=UPI000926BF98|nr:glycosyltransferase family 1 protein [Singulisphaera sp. GP187]SIO67373.1 Glycosyltransferase involved in cell wall bisynthesis [Singulisphaera sp. GP187]
MRVTVVTETYYPQVNGVSRTLGQLVRYLGEAGDEVQLIHPDYGVEPNEDRTLLVRAWPLPFYRELRLPLPPFGKIHRRIDEFRPDLIHIATEATLGLSLLGHARRRNIPVVSSFHTNFDQYSHHYRVGWAKGTIWRYLRWFHNRTLETYVPSLTTIAELEERGFERLVLWPRGVDSHLFRSDRPGRARIRADLGFEPEDVVLGYVSRLAVEKNVAYLVEAFERVAAARPHARFLLVGDGPARADLESKIGGQARFVGYRSGDDLADHYAAADVFAFSSLTETFGNVILEAMASGLPVVALRAGGVGNIVQPGVNGFLLEPDQSPEQFAETLIELVDDVALRQRLAQSARAFAVGKSWDAVMELLRQRYEKIISEVTPQDLSPVLAS